jgi:uncharacterized protein (TIGR03435 family)
MTNFATGSRGKLLLSLTIGLASAAPPSFGQSSVVAPTTHDAPAQLPAFEVASIKPTNPAMSGGGVHFTPDGFSAQGATLQTLLGEAFGKEDEQIIGAPSWTSTDRFDIQAKVNASDVPKLKDIMKSDQRWQLVVQLLADRSNLKLHHETKELPVYALVIAKGGPKLKEAKPGETYPNGQAWPNGGAGLMMMRRGKITGQGVAIAGLVTNLSELGLGRTIVDKTGLAGKYDFTLQWTPDTAPPPTAGGAEGSQPVNGAASQTDPGPSLFTALEEQLGLKLEPQKGPVDVIVIDHIERPSEN